MQNIFFPSKFQKKKSNFSAKTENQVLAKTENRVFSPQLKIKFFRQKRKPSYEIRVFPAKN